MLRQVILNYNSEKTASFQCDTKNRMNVAKHLLKVPNEGVLSIGKMSADLAQDFSDFFIHRIETIRNYITSKSKSSLKNLKLGSEADYPIACLEEFAPVWMSEIKKVIESSPTKSCELDPIPNTIPRLKLLMYQ